MKPILDHSRSQPFIHEMLLVQLCLSIFFRCSLDFTHSPAKSSHVKLGPFDYFGEILLG